MAAEPIQGLRYPAGGDEPDGPAAVKNLADDVVKLTNMKFASVAARDATLVGSSAPVDGMECFTGSGTTEVKWLRHNGQWVRIYGDMTVVPLTITGGFTGTMGYSKSPDGKLIIVQGDLIGSAPTGNSTVGQMPAAFYPTYGQPRGGLYLGGGYTGTSYVTSTGNIGFAQQTGASRSNPSFTVIYQIG